VGFSIVRNQEHTVTTAESTQIAVKSDTFAHDDLIVGLATPPGPGGIAILRVSGPGAVQLASSLFRPARQSNMANLPGYSVLYGHIVAPNSTEALDEALLTLFRAPKSYTGEDTVEFSCHGGPAVVAAVLHGILECGARLAEPGEFTRRAFMNGRIDLAQAEAVADVVHARTEEARKLAMRQLDGDVSRAVSALRHALIGLAAELEATIDFSDEIGDLNYEAFAEKLQRAAGQAQQLMAGADRAIAVRSGIRITLAGRPNVGKSSLMNALLREERAIVSPFAGTTRDRIDEQLQIDGMVATLSDTAGLRDALDPVEQIGVDRARIALNSADVALFVVDASAGITTEDTELASDFGQVERVIVVINKCDLVSNDACEALKSQGHKLAGPRNISTVCVSAATNAGIQELEAQISACIGKDAAFSSEGSAVLSNTRHLDAARRAVKCIALALNSTANTMPADFIGIDIRGALDALGEITGETVTEDIIHRIFADFCVGK
jgi:tRNA modification GTPase